MDFSSPRISDLPQEQVLTARKKMGQSTGVALKLGFFKQNYHLVMTNIAMENAPFLIGKPSINGAFSMAMLNNQRVYKLVFKHFAEIISPTQPYCSQIRIEAENWGDKKRRSVAIPLICSLAIGQQLFGYTLLYWETFHVLKIPRKLTETCCRQTNVLKSTCTPEQIRAPLEVLKPHG